MRRVNALTAALSGLAHTAADLSAPAAVLSTSTGRQSTSVLTNVSIDVLSLGFALTGLATLLLFIPPLISFLSELFRRIKGGGGGAGYDKLDTSGYSYDYDDSGYRQRRSADPYSAIWDKMSVLDWIAMMEEVYRKFDATSLECQQRLVCELHQNENSWGTTARKMNDAFSYLQYMELLNLPSELRMLLDEYLDAANKGRTSEKSCADHFAGCEFSMKTLISKYNGSNAL